MKKTNSKAAQVRDLIAEALKFGMGVLPYPADRKFLGYARGLVGQHNVFNGTALSVKYDSSSRTMSVWQKPKPKEELMSAEHFRKFYSVANRAYQGESISADDLSLVQEAVNKILKQCSEQLGELV